LKNLPQEKVEDEDVCSHAAILAGQKVNTRGEKRLVDKEVTGALSAVSDRLHCNHIL
jgi:hypothetical protein